MKKRIFIIGGPGSGKTTIARKLSQQYKIPFIDMDKIFFQIEKDRQIVNEEKDSQRIIQKFINDDAWITEGVYFRLNWMDPIVQKADKVFLLKTSKFVRDMRIIGRAIKQILTNDKNRSANFETIQSLLKLNKKFEQEGYTEINKRLSKLKIKLSVVYSLDDVLKQS